jgi:hypothetical protein
MIGRVFINLLDPADLCPGSQRTIASTVEPETRREALAASWGAAPSVRATAAIGLARLAAHELQQSLMVFSEPSRGR